MPSERMNQNVPAIMTGLKPCKATPVATALLGLDQHHGDGPGTEVKYEKGFMPRLRQGDGSRRQCRLQRRASAAGPAMCSPRPTIAVIMAWCSQRMVWLTTLADPSEEADGNGRCRRFG